MIGPRRWKRNYSRRALAAERDLRAELESEIQWLREQAAEAERAAIRYAAEAQARQDAENDLLRVRTEFESAIAAHEATATALSAEIESGRQLKRQIADRATALAERDLRLTELKRALAARTPKSARGPRSLPSERRTWRSTTRCCASATRRSRSATIASPNYSTTLRNELRVWPP